MCFDFEQELAADIQALSEVTSRIGTSLEIRAPTTQTTAYVKVLIFLLEQNSVKINFLYVVLILQVIAYNITERIFSFFS